MDSRSLSMSTVAAVYDCRTGGGRGPPLQLSRRTVSRFASATGPTLQDFFCLLERTRNDMNADQLTDTAGRNGTRFCRGFHGTDITTNEHCDVTVQKVFLAN